MPNLYKKITTVGLFLVFYSGHAAASIITSGCVDSNNSCTLAELQAGGSVNIDNVLFSDFDDSLSFLFDASKIQVSFIDSVGGENDFSNVGLIFNPFDSADNPWYSSDNGSGSADIQAYINYQISILSGRNIGAATLNTRFIENVSGGFYDSLMVREDIDRSPYGAVSLLTRCEDALQPFAACDGATVSKNIAFGPNSDPLFITTDIYGSATRVSGGGLLEIGVSKVTQVFTRTVPEPGVLALFSLGLLSVFASRRKAPPIKNILPIA
jgi:hypothetical protein